MPFNLGPLEITLIILLVLVFFGPKRLPEMARSFGQAIQEFRKAGRNVQKEITTAIEGDDEAASSRPTVKKTSDDTKSA